MYVLFHERLHFGMVSSPLVWSAAHWYGQQPTGMVRSPLVLCYCMQLFILFKFTIAINYRS